MRGFVTGKCARLNGFSPATEYNYDLRIATEYNYDLRIAHAQYRIILIGFARKRVQLWPQDLVYLKGKHITFYQQ